MKVLDPDEHEVRACLVLNRVTGMTAALWRRLLRCFGTAGEVLSASRADLENAGFGEKLPKRLALVDQRAVDADLTWLEGSNRQLLSFGNDPYPEVLYALSDPPPLLFAEGDLTRVWQPMIAIVGSRKSSAAGVALARRWGRELSDCGVAVVSGGARGIDQAAHTGALEGQTATIAVAGCGLDVPYPRACLSLNREIATSGLRLSEFGTGVTPRKESFPRRNRIISGLSLGVVVVEAALRSGSLVTAKLAADQGREVMAVPGPVQGSSHSGCHQLIRDGAALVGSVTDILDAVNLIPSSTVTDVQATNQGSDPVLESEELEVYSQLSFQPVTLDTLLTQIQLTPAEVCSILSRLELEGYVHCMPGGRFTRT